MIKELIQLDQDLFIQLHRLGSNYFDILWQFITNKYTWIPLYIIILYSVFKTSGKRVFLWFFVCATLMVLLTNGITDYFKNVLFMRLRPCHEPGVAEFIRNELNHCGGKYGFTSGHAGNHWALALFFFFTFLYRFRYGFLIFVWALTIAYSRIYLGVHYPLDVLGGIILGTFTFLLFFGLYKKYLPKFFE